MTARALLATGIAVATAAIALQLRPDDHDGKATPRPAAGVATAPDAAAAGFLQPRGVYDEIVARTLFAPARSPAVAVPAAAGIAPAPVALPRPGGAGRMRLVGITRTPGGELALLRDETGGTHHVAGAGDVVAGWTVARIVDDAVLLEGEGRRETLELERGSNGPAPARPAPRPVSPAGSPPSPAPETHDAPPATPR